MLRCRWTRPHDPLVRSAPTPPAPEWLCRTGGMPLLPLLPLSARRGGRCGGGCAVSAASSRVDCGMLGMLAESEMRLKKFMDRQTDITDMSRLQIIGTSGTVTTLAAVQLGLAKYDRNVVDGCTISSQDITGVIGDLRQLSREQLGENPCIGKQRADLVLAGCAVLEAIYLRWPVDKFSVADRGLREGLLMRMIRNDNLRRGRRRANKAANNQQRGRSGGPSK